METDNGKKSTDVLKAEIQEIKALIERARRDLRRDPEAVYALALLEQALEIRRKKLVGAPKGV